MHRSRISNKIIEFVVLALVVLICSALARGTTVTGTTVASGDGQLLTNARVTAEFVPKQGTFGSPVIPSVSATTDANGTFSMTLIDVNTINPSGGTWKFTVCPNATVPCTIISGVTITGTTQEIGGLITSNMPSLAVNAQTLVPKAYNDSQVPIADLSNIGALYWNSVTKNIRLWDGSNWNDLPNFKNINGIRYANQYTGADASVKINACIADVITAGGGICDARGIIGTQAMSQIIPVGNTGGTSVTLLLPNVGSWQWNTNIGANCAVTLYNKSSIIGNAASGEGSPFSFQGISGFNGTNVFCTANAGGAGADSYYRAEGFNVVLQTGATGTNAVTSLRHGADSSRFQSINTAVYGGATTPEALLVNNMCCGASLLNVGADSGTTATTGIHACVFGTGNVDLNVFGGSCVHAGPGANNILLQSGGNNSVNFFGTYVEQATNADGVTPQIEHSGATTGDRHNFYGLSCLMQNLNTAYCVHQAPGTAYMEIYGMLIRGEGATQYAINDELAGVQITVGAGGNIPSYSSINAFGNSQVYNTIKYSSGGLLDKDFNLLLNAGKTTSMNSSMCLQSLGVSKWCFQKTTSENLAITDAANTNYQRIIVNPGTTTLINSLGTSTNDFNMSTNSGTGGSRFGSGGATPSAVATINSSGLGTFNGGIKAGASGSIITDSRELIQFSHNCTSTATCANLGTNNYKEVFGTIALTAGTATLTGVTGFTTMVGCNCTDTTAIAACRASVVSSSSVTFTGTGTDTLYYQCRGN